MGLSWRACQATAHKRPIGVAGFRDKNIAGGAVMMTIFSHPYLDSLGKKCIAELNVDTPHPAKVFEKNPYFGTHTHSCMKKYAKIFEEDAALEWLCRQRRIINFAEHSGLLPTKSADSRRLYERASSAVWLDHVSKWKMGQASFILSEPYNSDEVKNRTALEEAGLCVIKIPLKSSPYCGVWSCRAGDTPATGSYLIADRKHLNLLNAVLVSLEKAEEDLLDWNDISSLKVHVIDEPARYRL